MVGRGTKTRATEGPIRGTQERTLDPGGTHGEAPIRCARRSECARRTLLAGPSRTRSDESKQLVLPALGRCSYVRSMGDAVPNFRTPGAPAFYNLFEFMVDTVDGASTACSCRPGGWIEELTASGVPAAVVGFG